jgi:hypothetical protein
VRGRGRGCGSEIHKIRRKNKERSREEKWRRRGDDVGVGVDRRFIRVEEGRRKEEEATACVKSEEEEATTCVQGSPVL